MFRVVSWYSFPVYNKGVVKCSNAPCTKLSSRVALYNRCGQSGRVRPVRVRGSCAWFVLSVVRVDRGGARHSVSRSVPRSSLVLCLPRIILPSRVTPCSPTLYRIVSVCMYVCMYVCSSVCLYVYLNVCMCDVEASDRFHPSCFNVCLSVCQR